MEPIYSSVSRTESHPLNLVRAGFVEKENPQRHHTYHRRLLVLTADAFYWFQRDNDHEFVGQERGRIGLIHIILVQKSSGNGLEFELRSSDDKKANSKRLFRCTSEAECDEWVNVFRHTLSSSRNSPFHTEDSLETTNDFKLGTNQSISEQITVVSIRTHPVDSPVQDIIINRIPERDDWFAVFDMHSTDELILTLSSGRYAVVPRGLLDAAGTTATGEISIPVLKTTASTVLADPPSAGAKIALQARRRDGDVRRRGSSAPVIDRSTPLGGGATATWGGVLTSLLSLGVLGCLVWMAVEAYLEGKLTHMHYQWWLREQQMLGVTLTLTVLLAFHSAVSGLLGRRAWRSEKLLTFAVKCRFEDPSMEAGPEDSDPMDPTVGEDSDAIPDRYLAGCDYDVEEARRRWELTRTWRAAERIDGILFEKQPHFKLIKELYPHYMCGFAKKNQIVYYERPGHIKISELRNSGITTDQLVRHYVFTTEFQWAVSAPRKDHQSISVLDLDGVNMGMLTASDIVESLRRIVSLGNMHYPERAFTVYIVNAPSWYSFCWKIVKHLVSEKTQNKIRILSKKETLAGLMEHIDLDEIPVYYGGHKNYGDIDSCRFQSPEEREMAQWVDRLNNDSDNPPTKLDLIALAHKNGGPPPPPSRNDPVVRTVPLNKQSLTNQPARTPFTSSSFPTYAASDVDEVGSQARSPRSSAVSWVPGESDRSPRNGSPPSSIGSSSPTVAKKSVSARAAANVLKMLRQSSEDK